MKMSRYYYQSNKGGHWRGSKAVLIGASSLLALTLASTASAASAAENGTETAMVTAAAVAAPAAEQSAPAQSNDASVVEEVVVTGLRGSLQRNLDIKRNAEGVVDAISAEDIGK